MSYRIRKCKMCGEKFVPSRDKNTICSKEECKRANRKIIRDRHRKKAKKLLAEEAKIEKIKIDTLAEADAKARDEGTSYGKRELRIWMEKQKMERRRTDGD